MTFGKELLQSAKEALAIAEGRTKPAAVLTVEKTDVACCMCRDDIPEDCPAGQPAGGHPCDLHDI